MSNVFSSPGMLILRETMSHSIVLLALDLLFNFFEIALELIDRQFPHSPSLSYIPLDTIRVMVTIADSVAVVLFSSHPKTRRNRAREQRRGPLPKLSGRAESLLQGRSRSD